MDGTIGLDANDLTLFVRVVDAGSFSAAAARTELPKSTVSRRIAGLERALGERLLVRTTRRLAITDFGEAVLAHARRLVDAAESAAAFARQRQRTPQGRLRVSLPPEFEELDLVHVLADFALRHPLVHLELDVSPHRADLLAERFDLAVRMARSLPDDATLVARPLTDLGGGLYASPDYLARAGEPAQPADLLGHVGLPVILSGGEAQAWSLLRGDARWEGVPSGPVGANSIGLQAQLAVAGLGIVGLSDRFAERWTRDGRLRRVLPAWQLPSVTAWAVTPGRRLLPAHTAAFIAHLRSALESPA